MFGLSPSKLLFTVIVIAAIWYGFKWLGQRQNDHDNRPDKKSGSSGASGASKTDSDYEDLVACPKCGDFVIADKKSGCAKDGCPFER